MRQKSERIIYLSLFFVKKKIKVCPLYFFFEVLEKVKPVIGLKIYKRYNRKINKVTAISYILNVSKRYKKAIFWLSKAIKLHVGSNLFIKIFRELYETVYLNSSLSLKKKRKYYDYVLLFKKAKRFKW